MKEIQIKKETVDLNKKIHVEISLHELLVLYCALRRSSCTEIRNSLESYGYNRDIYSEDADDRYFEELGRILQRHGVIR